MRQLVIISFLLSPLLGFTQKQTQLLANAYKQKSINKLHLFFENWVQETHPISDKDFANLNDTAKNVYTIFQTYYTPKELSKIGGSEWGDSLYRNVKYLLIQDKIIYEIGDSNIITLDDTINYVSYITTKDNSAFQTGTLYNFRPNVPTDSSKVVVLTKNYDRLFNYFLGNTHKLFAAGNIMAPAKSEGESNKRQKFLENYIKIFYGHWGGYWQLYSYPTVEKVRFDKSFSNAIIFYTMVYEHGEAYLKKIEGKWTIIKAERTSIE